jgi:hypothetical protein
VTWPAFSFASACISCSSFLVATSASEAACFFALMTSSSSRSSVSNRVSVARSSCSRRSAAACSACHRRHLGQLRGCFVDRCLCVSHLTLRDFVYERFKFLAHFVDTGRGIVKRLTSRGNVRLHLFCIDDGYLVRERSYKPSYGPSSSVPVCISFC